MKMETTRRMGAALLAATGLLHLVLAPEYLEEQIYVGVLFVLGAIACGLVALRLWRSQDLAAWTLGSLIAAGMAAGFIISRTTGLPGFHEGEWELSGLVSLLLEGGFIGLALAAVRPALGQPGRATAS